MAIINNIYWNQESFNSIIYKHPGNEITLGSVLTVNDSQEAFFFKNGTLCDRFTGGRHVLSSANLPILNKLINLPSGGESTFHAEVWFVNILDNRSMFWGTGGLRIIDPYFEIPIKIFARGGYGFRIEDGALFLKKFVGTQSYVSSEFIEEQFRITIVEAVKVTISKFMKEKGININELGSEYFALSNAINQKLHIDFAEYGVSLLNFNIEDINFDEEDPGYQKVMDSIAEQARLRRLGVSYVQERQMDITQTAAGNQGAGNMMGAGMGLAMGQQMGAMMAQAMQPMQQQAIQMAPPPPPTNDSFYVAQNGASTGPFPIPAIQQMIANGTIQKETYVYKVGGTAWIAAGQEPMLMGLFAPVPPPPPCM